MSTSQTVQVDYGVVAGLPAETPQWFAIRTRSHHEKMVADQLARQSIESFLPLVKKIHKWSDRKKVVELPLFTGYTFARLVLRSPDRLRVLKTHGVAGFVGVRDTGIPVPEGQIENLRTILANEIPMKEHPFLEVGQRVRVKGGALDGIEGTLASKEGRTLVISVEPIQRSLSISIDGYCVEPL
jgi:transcription antitermination factor NusG